MNFNYVAAAVALAGLSLTGTALRPLVESSATSAGIEESISAATHAESGGSLAVLGGLRTMMADLTWLRAYVSWEYHDAPATTALLHLTTSLDPQPTYFWLNGARMMAYDIPAWIRADGRTETEIATVDRRQAQAALAFLDEALLHHSGKSAIWIERANIQLHRLHDVAAAADSYGKASETSDAPYFAARIHAELLRRVGRTSEALAVLTKLYPALPLDDDAAAAALVLDRIRNLERDLATRPECRFQPEPNPRAARLHL